MPANPTWDEVAEIARAGRLRRDGRHLPARQARAGATSVRRSPPCSTRSARTWWSANEDGIDRRGAGRPARVQGGAGVLRRPGQRRRRGRRRQRLVQRVPRPVPRRQGGHVVRRHRRRRPARGRRQRRQGQERLRAWRRSRRRRRRDGCGRGRWPSRRPRPTRTRRGSTSPGPPVPSTSPQPAN